MATIKDLKPSISELEKDVGIKLILDIRNNRLRSMKQAKTSRKTKRVTSSGTTKSPAKRRNTKKKMSKQFDLLSDEDKRKLLKELQNE